MKKLLIPGLIVALLFAAGACKKAGEKLAEKAVEKALESQGGEKADVDLSEGKIKITSKEAGKEGSLEIAGGGDLKLPDDFPKDVPIYPNTKITSSMKQGPQYHMLVLTTKDKGAKIYEFYQKKLKDANWDIKQEMQMDKAYTLAGQKGNRNAAVIIGESDEESTISITITQEQG